MKISVSHIAFTEKMKTAFQIYTSYVIEFSNMSYQGSSDSSRVIKFNKPKHLIPENFLIGGI